MLFADANAADFGMVILTLVNAVGAAFTFWVKAKYDARFATLEGNLKSCVEKHAEAEKDSAAALAEIGALKQQNTGQQGMIDTLTGRILSLVGAMHAQGIPTGSAPHAKLDDDPTDEHTPLAPG